MAYVSLVVNGSGEYYDRYAICSSSNFYRRQMISIESATTPHSFNLLLSSSFSSHSHRQFQCVFYFLSLISMRIFYRWNQCVSNALIFAITRFFRPWVSIFCLWESIVGPWKSSFRLSVSGCWASGSRIGTSHSQF